MSSKTTSHTVDRPALTKSSSGWRQRAISWRHRTALPPLSATTRILLLILGWLLFLLGLLGLVLPGLQGILTLLASAAVLSLVSPTVLGWMRRLFRPWPQAWRRLLTIRKKIHGWLSR